jgi:hypothetical protein
MTRTLLANRVMKSNERQLHHNGGNDKDTIRERRYTSRLIAHIPTEGEASRYCLRVRSVGLAGLALGWRGWWPAAFLGVTLVGLGYIMLCVFGMCVECAMANAATESPAL